MIVVYLKKGGGIHPVVITPSEEHLLQEALWIDLLSPTREDEKLIETLLKIYIPSKTEMQEIEWSSRLYKENHTLFMTVTMIAKSDSTKPQSDAVTFILMQNRLITIRYIEPQAFRLFTSRLPKLDHKDYHPDKILIGLLESTTDRLADILENLVRKFDDISQSIFHTTDHKLALKGVNYKNTLQNIGINSDLGTKIRESLLSFNRLVVFLGRNSTSKLDLDSQNRLDIIIKDIKSLSDHANFLSTKANFLLDATLGMINIEQNTIIKAFSIAAVIFLPPMLIASIYGMNFRHMPELFWHLGYPFAITFMTLSAWIPYLYFKKHNWL
jgi:magnesium transporter